MRIAIVSLAFLVHLPLLAQAPSVAVFESAPRQKIDGKAIAQAVADGVKKAGREVKVLTAGSGERFDKKCAEDASCRQKAMEKAAGAEMLFSETWIDTAQKPAAVVVEVYAVGRDGVLQVGQAKNPSMVGLKKALATTVVPLLDALAAARPAPAEKAPPADNAPAKTPPATTPPGAATPEKAPEKSPENAPEKSPEKSPENAPAASPAPAVAPTTDSPDAKVNQPDDAAVEAAPDDEEGEPSDVEYEEDEFEEEPVDTKGGTRVWSEPDDVEAEKKKDDRFVVEEKPVEPKDESFGGPLAYWGWIGGFVGIGAAMAGTGVLFDLFSPTSLNEELDLGDGVGPVLVIGGAALAVVGILLNPFSLEEEGDDA